MKTGLVKGHAAVKEALATYNKGIITLIELKQRLLANIPDQDMLGYVAPIIVSITKEDRPCLLPETSCSILRQWEIEEIEEFSTREEELPPIEETV